MIFCYFCRKEDNMRRAFSLIELIVVIIVVGILAAVGIS